MRERVSNGVGRAWQWLASAFDSAPPARTEGPDLSRRLLLTGVAAVACTAVVAGLPSPAAAGGGPGVEFYFGGGHSRSRSQFNHDRRRSYFDAHSRRRSRDSHSRDRSRGHGRRRSRSEYRDWNDDCALTPFGWFCF